MIDKMVRRGLILRLESTADPRRRNVVLSAKGKTLVDRIVVARAARFDASLNSLAPHADGFLKRPVRQIRIEPSAIAFQFEVPAGRWIR